MRTDLLYVYYAFGLHIASEIECPQLLAGGGSPPDLTIRYGRVMRELEQAQTQGTNYQASAGRFLLHIQDTARYLVKDGCEIVVEPYGQAAAEVVRLFLLGSAMGALLHQRGYWPLHGSAIAAPSGAILFVGASGHGKSTLAGAFHQRGYPALSDDVSAITVSEAGLAQVWPAYPRLHLWADSAAKLGRAPSGLRRAHNDLDKFELPVQGFSLDPLPVAAIYALYVAEQEGIRLQPLKGFEKVRELTSNTYRLRFLHGMQLEQRHFGQAQALARRARLVRVTRPAQPFLLEELADRIQEDLPR